MRHILIALPLIVAAPLLAQQDAAPQLPGAADPARVVAGSYAVDSRHSQVNWQVNHFGFNDYFGLFGDIKGTLQIDPANPAAAKVDVTIPIASVATSSQGLTDHLKTADFFDAANLPLGSTPVLTGPIGQTAPAIYPFPVVENVKRVDLVVLSLNPSPRLEIREVAFNWSDVVATEGSSWSQVKVLFR